MIWRINKRDVFIRDIVRDYCKVHLVLNEQSDRFAHSGTISYAVLNELLGDVLRKGVLWRLKDAAHHIFRLHPEPAPLAQCNGVPVKNDKIQNSIEQDVLAEMLDWCIGYTFHECVKLKEDAFQRQHYTNRLLFLRKSTTQYETILDGLMPFTKQTHESIAREMERILGVLLHIRNLLLLFLPEHRENGHIARLIVEDKSLVQQCFGQNFDDLLSVLYGPTPSKYYVLALQLTLSSGHNEKALNIMKAAQDDDVPASIITEMQTLMEDYAKNAS